MQRIRIEIDIRQLVILVFKRTHKFVAQTQIQSEALVYFPVVLNISCQQSGPPIDSGVRAECAAIYIAEKEIGNGASAGGVKRIPGISAAEAKVSSLVPGIQVIGLYPLKVKAESEVMISLDPAGIVF